ncbi:MAG: putative manganese-dependent inorganic diphosphatase [Bacilli bacterium]|nr:putative manganese-dependent inorganic diphosphatase [Bacilli bacterium]
MDKVYIFGHKKPDTDSVVSSIALSYLKNKLGMNTEARVLGDINKETKYVLDYFRVAVPKYLNDVKLQLKDINYHHDFYIEEDEPLYTAYQKMVTDDLTAIPVVDKDKEFLGLITIKDLARDFLKNTNKLITSYDNLLDVLKGTEVLKVTSEIESPLVNKRVIVTEKINNISLDDIDLIVLINSNELSASELEIVKEKRINVISTLYDSYNVGRLISLSNYTNTLVENYNTIKFSEDDYVDNVLDVNKKLKHANYPIVDKYNKCLGLLKITDLNDKRRKQVVLVDHNDKMQSADGIDEAEIIEIVDHHNLGNLTTNKALNYTAMVVGSTSTIIYYLFAASKIEIPKDIAGLLLSGILSDTLVLKSTTATKADIKAVKELSRITGIDYERYGMELIAAGNSLENMSKEDILYNDFKVYNTKEHIFAVGQFFTNNYTEIKEELPEYIKVLDQVASANNYSLVTLYITDITKDGSYVLYNTKAKETIEMIYGVDDLQEGTFIKGCMSRKQHIVPLMMEYFEN